MISVIRGIKRRKPAAQITVPPTRAIGLKFNISN
jgi:hypothetical protein